MCGNKSIWLPMDTACGRFTASRNVTQFRKQISRTGRNFLNVKEKQ